MAQVIAGCPRQSCFWIVWENGNITAVTDAIDYTKSQYFGYDSLNRISAALEYPGAGGWGQSYTIDAWGNLTNVGNYDSNNLSPYGYNQNASAANRAEDTGSGFQNDPAGNMTENGSDEYTWDAESRMTNYGGVWNYIYDANGMRARKEKVVNNVVTDWTEYVYFGGNVIAEKDISGAWTDYIFAGGKRVAKIAGGNIEYYHSDHLGSSTAMSNASGAIISQQTFLPYGCEYNRTTGSCAGTVPANHYKFTGKERDSESNLDYFGARYYSNTMGRWMSPDWSDAPEPVPYADFGDPQSLNLYGYVGNRPSILRDADGHEKLKPSDWSDKASPDVHIEVDSEAIEAAADVAGVIDPTGIVDGSSAVVHAAMGNFDKAAISAASILPGGDVLKAAKYAGKAAEASAPTLRAARHEAMRKEGIPTSQQPSKQTNGKNAKESGRQYEYDVAKKGGGTETKIVTVQKKDRNHGVHVEAGKWKPNKQRDPSGRKRHDSKKTKVNVSGSNGS